MAWYDDRSRTQFVANYSNVKQLEQDLAIASRNGWQPVPADSLFTANQQAKITVQFIRSPEWIAEREREMAEKFLHSAVRSADERQGKVVREQDALARAEERFRERRDRVRGAPLEKIEKEILDALKDVIAKRRSVLAALERAITDMASALTLGGSEFSGTLARYQRAQGLGKARLDAELRALREQESLVAAAKRWSDADAARRKAETDLRKRIADFEHRQDELSTQKGARDDALAGLPPADI
jgi:hypothetical protein